MNIRILHTSASDQALPPPVETVFRCRCSAGERSVCLSVAGDDLTIAGFWVGA